MTRKTNVREVSCSGCLHEMCLVLFAEGSSPVLQNGKVFVSHVEYLVQQFGEPGEEEE